MRRPVQLVQIDYPFCSRTFGSAPCLASGTKCYNTSSTCTYRDALDLQDLTLTFAQDVDGLQKTQTIFPALESVSTSTTELNVAGASGRSGPLGKRARVTIVISDFPYHDRLTDKYERDYDPMQRGTFWRKFLARVPYVGGIKLRVLDGYEGEALASMRTRHYLIESIDGPTDGKVTITAKDILMLAEDKRAMAPAPTDSVLTAPMTAETVIIVPTNIDAFSTGDAIRIGSEIMYVALKVADTLVLARPSPESHSTGDAVQICLALNDRIDTVIKDLLIDYAGIDASWWAAANDTEGELYLRGLVVDALITEPTPVNQLLGELAEVGPSIWWDELSQQIKIRAIRPAIGDELKLIKQRDIISLTQKMLPDDQITQLWVYYGIVSATSDAKKATSYRRLAIRIDTQKEAEVGESRARTVYTRMLSEASEGAVKAFTARTFQRFLSVPLRVTIRMDAKDRETYSTGDVVELTADEVTDASGAAVATIYQIISASEPSPGHIVEYVLQSIGDRAGIVTYRPCYVQDNAMVDYDDATASEKDPAGGWISDGTDFADGPQYTII